MHWTSSLLPRSRHPLACLCSDKALMESNMRIVLTPVSLIYQDYWHLQKQVVCLDEMFPRQKEEEKKNLAWRSLLLQCLNITGSSQRGKKQWKLCLQEALGVLRMFHPQLPSPPLALFFPYMGMWINPLSPRFWLCLLPHLPHRTFPIRPHSVSPPPPRGPPHLFSVRSSFSECRLVEFGVQTPSSDESPGAAEGPFAPSLPPPPLSLPVPHSPLCNNMLEPTSVFNCMFIWTALGKWKLSLKTGVLKQQHEYKQLYLTNKGIYT